MLHPFPHKLNGSLYLLVVDHPLILRQEHGRAIATPATSFLQSCLNPAPRIYTCFASPLIYVVDVPSCHRSLLSLPQSVPDLCIFNEIPVAVSPFILSMQDVTLLYYFQNTAATVTCNTTTPMRLLVGTFVLPTSCELNSLSTHIPATRNYITQYNVGPQLNVPSLINLPTHNFTLEQLKLKKINKVEELPKFGLSDHQLNYFYPIYINVAGLFASILIFVGLIFLMKWIRTRVNKDQVHGSRDGQDEMEAITLASQPDETI